MAIKIVVNNKSLNGNHTGLEFVNGVAIVEDEAFGREIASQFEYEIEEDEKEEAPKKAASKAKAKKEDKE